jgi:thiamine pyrophosphate-dependent acetolactate synthase large subunit-like protein
MKDMEIPKQGERSMAWGSDVAAEMLRAVGIRYVALNPGASFRGLHDSMVNYLGNRDPQMLLCLNEDHVVSIAHGFAKASDEMMACVLHSNVGLLHGLMGIFNAWCDRMPMLVVGATGPVAPEKRRPWIDWIHTAKDQGALLRNFSKWDDEPRSPEGVVEGFLRAAQISRATPRGPTYVCLDAGLQEQALSKPVTIPDVARFKGAPEPSASSAQVDQVAELLAGAKKPVILMGRVSRLQEDWDRRVRLAELTGASVLTSIRERSAFPTDHPLHAAPPFFWMSKRAKEVVAEADLVLGLDWPDLNGTLQQCSRNPAEVAAKIVHVSLDSTLHNGWSMDYFGLVPADVSVLTGADTFVGQLLPAIEQRLGSKGKWRGDNRNTASVPEYSRNAATEIAPRDVEVALAKARGDRKLTLAHVTIGWAGDVYHFQDPLDFLGHDGGAGLAAGPGLTVGAALALKDSGRTVVSVLGDGDYIQGVTALWTAAHYRIPALFIVSNNRSNFNDEIHQEAVAKMRNRPVENRWIGQRIDDPAVDIVGLARAQGVEAEGPVENIGELEAAIERGLAAVAAGRPYLIDAHVIPGYASPPLSRGE